MMKYLNHILILKKICYKRQSYSLSLFWLIVPTQLPKLTALNLTKFNFNIQLFIIKDAELGLKLSKIKAELQALTQFSAELEQASQGFKTAVNFIKKLKATYDHKKILLQVQSLADPVPKVAGNSPDKTYNQLASALSEIRAVSRIYPELEKAQHIFDTMRDDVNQFRKFAQDFNIQQSQLDQSFKNVKEVHVLEHDIYESSSTEEEEVHKVQSKQTFASPPQAPGKSAKQATPEKGKQAPSKDARPAPPQAKKAAPTVDEIESKHLGMHKSVKGHSKHKNRHENKRLINVQKKQ